MRKSYTYRSQALRFRRWSRKAYAAFISVQRAVTIGQLSFSVADRFEKKNQSLHTGIGTFTDGFSEEDDEERENTEENKRSLAYRMDCLRHYSRYWYQMRSLIRLIV